MAGPSGQPHRRLLAIKALSLAVGLSGHARHVGCILLDHFNDDTGRCDPAVGTISELMGVSDKSVFRALEEICDRDDGPDTGKPFVRAARQGVRNTTSHSVRWEAFDAMLKGWEEHRNALRKQLREASRHPKRYPANSSDTDTGDRMTARRDTDTGVPIVQQTYGQGCPFDTVTGVQSIRTRVTDKPILITQPINPRAPSFSPKGLSGGVRNILIVAMSGPVADAILAHRHAGGAPLSMAEARAIAEHVQAYDDRDAAAIALAKRNYRGVRGLRRIRLDNEKRKRSRAEYLEMMDEAFEEAARGGGAAGRPETVQVHPDSDRDLWAALERRAGRKLKAFSASGTRDFPTAEVAAAREDLALSRLTHAGGRDG